MGCGSIWPSSTGRARRTERAVPQGEVRRGFAPSQFSRSPSPLKEREIRGGEVDKEPLLHVQALDDELIALEHFVIGAAAVGAGRNPARGGEAVPAAPAFQGGGHQLRLHLGPLGHGAPAHPGEEELHGGGLDLIELAQLEIDGSDALSAVLGTGGHGLVNNVLDYPELVHALFQTPVLFL